MVDIEFLRKNCTYCNWWGISTLLKSAEDGIWDYRCNSNKEEKEKIKEGVYEDLVTILAYLFIMGIDFSDRDFKRDIDLVLQHIERREKIRCLNNDKIQEVNHARED